MIVQIVQDRKESSDRIHNIKGLSWMLKTNSGTASVTSTNSSNIDQRFKIFKLKDEKAKWKKKINKKFESVGQKIQATIKSQYNEQQPFNSNYKKQVSICHTPHLRQINNVHLLGGQLKPQTKSFINQKSKSNSEVMLGRSLNQKQNPNNDSKCKDNNNKQQPDKIFNLVKSLTEMRNENLKVSKTKNILRIHANQKQFMEKHNEQFFKKQFKWIQQKVQSYNQFDIHQYEQDLIQKRCSQQK